MELRTLLRLVGRDQVYVSPSQIAGFFDQQYYCKESVYVFDFLHGDNHQGKVASKTAAFGRVSPVVRLVQSDCMIL